MMAILRGGDGMKVLGIVGSPRNGGNCEILTNRALNAIAEEGIETELIKLAGLDIRPCNACMKCKKEELCGIADDLMPIYLKMKEADGFILASPVYHGSAPGLTKSFMERTGYMARWNGRPFERKVAGPIVVARRAGQNFTFAQILMWCLIEGMIVPGSTYWNVAFGLERGEVNKDQEGLDTIWNFGKNMAWLLKKVHA
jgi:multimeric flavodoxin WrbA